MDKTIIILPTYNEAQNLKPLVDEILKLLPRVRLLVVDDNSSDGTGKIADQLSSTFPNQVSVLHRAKKEGLGKAYLASFQYILKMDVEKIIHMDVDFSHPVSLLPKIISCLNQYDFVLGSRYVPGGGTKNWGLKRRVLSRLGNIYAKTILKSPVQDLTGGFKGFNRRVIEYLLRCPLESHGYNFQIETTTRAITAGFSFQEIPFIFTERKTGVSKMSQGIIWEAMIKTFRLRKILKTSPHAPFNNSHT